MARVTLSQLRTSLARALRDPDHVTFSITELTDLVNAGIVEVSRIAPQQFVEDIDVAEGEVRYQLHGGSGNMVSNWSFEEGDADVLAGYTEVAADDPDSLMSGWAPSVTADVGFLRRSASKNGRRSLCLRPTAGAVNTYVYQDIPVDPDVTYAMSGWHWKSTQGSIPCKLAFQTLDVNGAVVQTIASWTTTQLTPVYRTASVTTASDGSEDYIRVYVMLNGTQKTGISRDIKQMAHADAIKIVESGQATLVSNESIPDIEIGRVEVWTVNDDEEEKFNFRIPPAGEGYEQNSSAGWSLWGGDLYLPDRIADTLSTDTDFIRVFGYSPFDRLDDASDVSDLTDSLQFAVLTYGQKEALRRLMNDRGLYTQWQTRAGNTDISPAGLMNMYNMAREEWRQQSRALTRLRSST